MFFCRSTHINPLLTEPTMKVVLIIEDDFPFAVEIEMMLIEVGGYLPKIVSTFKEAQLMLQSLKPDIILSDIHLDGDYTVFDLLKMEHLEIPLVLFSSVDSDEVFNKAQSLKSYIFLVKPFNVRSLRSAVENLLKAKAPQKKTFFVKSKGKHLSINSDEITYIESEGNYSNIQLQDDRITTRATFDNILEKCENPSLIRVHRSYIVNSNFIESINSDSTISMKSGTSIPLGRKYKPSIKSLLS